MYFLIDFSSQSVLLEDVECHSWIIVYRQHNKIVDSAEIVYSSGESEEGRRRHSV